MSNLSENLKQIKTAFNDIKTSLNEIGANISENDSVTEYAKAVNNLAVDTFSGTFIIFKQSETTPDIPEGGSWNGTLFEYPYGWGSNQRSEMAGDTWMSYAIITQNNSNSITWSTPIKISGNPGKSSELGTTSIDGILYWTVNGELIYDENNNPVRAEGLDGKHANTSFTSTVFTRSDQTPIKPTGGTYFDPIPEVNEDGLTWLDYIPAGEEFLWMSSRTFSSDGLYPQSTEWSDPSYAADTADIDFAFSSNETQPPSPISHGDHTGDENWYNEGDENSIWMAVSKMRNNEWGSWKITKIKGERGDTGPTGPTGPTTLTFTLADHEILVPVEEDGSIDPDWYATDQSELLNLHLYKGTDEEIPSSEIEFGYESYPQHDSNLLEVLDGVAHINRSSLGNVSKIKFTATYNDVVYEDTCHFIKEKHGYELRVNTTTLFVDSSRTVNSGQVIAYLTKWDGTSFVPVSEKRILATYNTSDGNRSTFSITTDNDGEALLDRTYSNVQNILIQYVGEARTLEQYVQCVTNGPKGDPGKGITGIIKYYRANNDPNTPPTLDEEDKWKLDITEAGLSSTNRYLWCWELISFTDHSTKSSRYIIAVEGQPGATGTGKNAPIIYPAGVWRSDKAYTASETKVPYVYHVETTNYYILKTGKTSPAGTDPTNTSYWDVMESFDALYANIGIFNQALVGSWVFHGEYMFSQMGRGASTPNGPISNSISYLEYESPKDAIITYISRKPEYDNKIAGVTSEFPWFCPNVIFNAATGQFFLASGQIYNGSDGTLFFGRTSHNIGGTLDTILREYIWSGKDYVYTHSINNANTLIYASKLFLGSNSIPGTFTLQLKNISDLQQGRSIKVVFLGQGLTRCSKKIQCFTYGREVPIQFLNLPEGLGNAGITSASSFGTTYTVPSECTSLDIHFIVDGITTYAAIC